MFLQLGLAALLQARSAQVWLKPHTTHSDDGAWKPHTQISPKTTSAQQGSCGERKLRPRGSRLVLLWHKQGPRGGSCWGPVQHSSQCSRTGAKGISPNLGDLRGPGEGKATAKPFHISVIQKKTGQKNNQPWKPAVSFFFNFSVLWKSGRFWPKGGTGTAMGGTSWFPSQSQSQHWAVSLSQAQNVQTTRGCHRAGIFRAFTSSLNPGLFPWQLSRELIKLKKKKQKKNQEQFEHRLYVRNVPTD